MDFRHLHEKAHVEPCTYAGAWQGVHSKQPQGKTGQLHANEMPIYGNA